MTKKTEKKAPVLNKYFFDLLGKLGKDKKHIQIYQDDQIYLEVHIYLIVLGTTLYILSTDALNYVDWNDFANNIEVYNCTTGKKMRRVEITKVESIEYKD